MNIKEKIEDVVKKLTSDKDLLKDFKEDPIKTLESKLGINLPDEQMQELIKGIKAKVSVDEFTDKVEDIKDAVEDKVDDLKDKIGGLFHKDK